MKRRIEIEKPPYKMVQLPNRDLYCYKDGELVMHILNGNRRLTRSSFGWYLKFLNFVETEIKENKIERVKGE